MEIIAGILSSQIVGLAILVAVIGVAIRTYSGMIGKPWREVRWNLVIFTFIVSILTSVNIVIPALEELPTQAEPTRVVQLLIGEVLTIVGADAVAKKAAQHPKIKERLNGGGGRG